ncbi:IS110 family transposase, partial [Pseudoalteromonas sp. SG44-1]|nr:IS110 family transposase [Pseudoalteromonas sp. SG44-1]
HGADLKAHVANTASQYNLPAHNVNLKNVCDREKMRYYFPDPVVQRSINLNMAILDCYHKELKPLEHYIEQMAKQHNPVHLNILQTINGIGRILALT